MIETEFSLLLERYQRLIALSRDLASTLDLSVLLNRIVHAAANLCQAQAASILLYDESHRQLYFHAATNLDAPLMEGLVVPVDSSIAGWIVQNREPAIILDTRNDPRHFRQIGQVTQVETQSLLGVPMITKDKVIGVLEVINKLAGSFTQEDQDLLMALGAQAAVAIENTRLFNQSDLISEMVHEIRTPLASLSAATHLLKRENLDASVQENIVDTMQQEIQRLSDMTSAFLDLARLESGRTQFHFESVVIKELLMECAMLVSSKIEEKKLDMSIHIAEGLPTITADYDKIKQLVLNLLSNAIKYTPEGGRVTLSAASQPGEVIIQVSDNGVGIPDEHLERIFEKFYRVPGIEHTAQGTGLGLSICKRIAEGHHGRIEVQSQTGVGSTFSVYLPVSLK